MARLMRLPLSKSAPRAICAFMILSASSIRVGMKRRAMVIIMASSCAGKCSLLRGLSSVSMPSHREMGEVVSVSTEVPATRKISRMQKCTAVISPSRVMRRMPQLTSTVSPLEKNRFSTKVRISRNRRGFTVFRSCAAFSPDILAHRIRNASGITYHAGLDTQKIMAI